ARARARRPALDRDRPPAATDRAARGLPTHVQAGAHLVPAAGRVTRREEAAMRGSLKRRYKGSWSLILDLGREADPVTGRTRRRQKWVTFRGTRQQAEAKLTNLLGAAGGGTFVEPSKVTLLDWMRDWVEKAV